MIKAENITYNYKNGKVLSFPDLMLEKGGQKLITGPSGCGKTTYLNILALFIAGFNGNLNINNTNIKSLTTKQKDVFRAENIGIIFQQPYFIASLNVFENIFLAAKKSKNEIIELSKELGIDDLLNKNINKLSLGEKQRVGIARVIAQQPNIILADEPTSSLDDANATKVVDLLIEQSKANNATLLIVTHDQRIKNKIANTIEL